jgi:hypothetical protein
VSFGPVFQYFPTPAPKQGKARLLAKHSFSYCYNCLE